MKITMQLTENGYIPVDDSIKKCEKHKIGSFYNFDIKENRNYPMLQKYMVMITKAWENSDYEHKMSKEQFRKQVIKFAGFYDESVNFGGEIEYTAKSISFEKMEQDEFNDLYSRSKDAILKYVFPTMDEKEFINMIVSF